MGSVATHCHLVFRTLILLFEPHQKHLRKYKDLSIVMLVFCFGLVELRSLFTYFLVKNDNYDDNVWYLFTHLYTIDRYHLDKNANNPEASELFKEVAYSYSVLSDPEKRRQYDSVGFEVHFLLSFSCFLFFFLFFIFNSSYSVKT